MSSPLPPSTPPTFPKHDPATPAFWDARFDAAYTPWDHGAVPQCLINYIAQSSAPKNVLIPGCGSAHEVRFFAERGWEVTAIDFSPAAVARAKQLLGTMENHVREADFFGEVITQERFDLIYERAFLCALPRRLWNAWAARVAQLISLEGYLVGFFFFDAGEKGPPFGIGSGQLTELLSPHFTLIAESEPADSIAIFAGKEKSQVWQRVPSPVGR